MQEKADASHPGVTSGRPRDPADATAIEVSSAVCYAGEAADAYMGYLDHDSLVVELNTLLEAERAGAQVAARLVSDAWRPELKALARVIQHDEVRWCRMLIKSLQALDVTPSKAVGGFYEQAMAIPDVVARFVFVNRGQAWVVRKLKTLLPKVRADGLHADLLAMLAAHDHNITQAELALAGLARGGRNLALRRRNRSHERTDGHGEHRQRLSASRIRWGRRRGR